MPLLTMCSNACVHAEPIVPAARVDSHHVERRSAPDELQLSDDDESTDIEFIYITLGEMLRAMVQGGSKLPRIQTKMIL